MKQSVSVLVASWSFFVASLAVQGQPVINEIMYHPATTNLLEDFIELYNPGTNTVDLSGWKLTKAVQYSFPTNSSISAGGYLVVAADAKTFTNKYPTVTNWLAPWTGKLSRNGEEIQLEDNTGQAVNNVSFASEGDWAIRRLAAPDAYGKVGWEWFAEHDGSGKTLELINAALPNSFGQNWGSSTPINGTPGRVNSITATNIPPMIEEVSHFPVIPKSTDPVTITTRIIDERTNGLTVTLFWRVDGAPSTNFNTATMFDDGLHGDGLANDGIYGAILGQTNNQTVVEFLIQARDAQNNLRTFPNVQSPGADNRTANLVFQVDNAVYNGIQPIYRLIMTSAEFNYLSGQVWNGSVNSDAAVSGTFISIDGIVDGGLTTKRRYNVGLRNRGHGSRSSVPHNIRVEFAADDLWKKRSALNLNTQFTQAQLLGSSLFRRLGIPMADSRPVQVRVNASNLANAGSSQFGSYEANDEVNSDMVSEQFPLDSQGNLYRGIRDVVGASSADFVLSDLACANPTDCYTNAFFKQNNTLEGDYSDLAELITIMNPSTPAELANYTNEIRRVANVDEWMKFLALNIILDNQETTLATGFGDDYAMYRGTIDKRFLLLPYDMDSIMGAGTRTTTYADGLFRFGGIGALNRMVTNADFLPVYYGYLRDLCRTTFAPNNINPLLDQLKGQFDANAQLDTAIANMKAFNASQIAYVLSQFSQSLTVSHSLPISNGYPLTTTPTIELFGQSSPVDTRSVLVNGSPAVWTLRPGTWDHTAVTLRPGINRVLVQALDGIGTETARTNIDIWYDDASVAAATVNAGSNFWSAAGGPYLVSGAVTVPAGAIVRVQAGASVYFAAGASLTVNGQLLAQGTDTAHIRFTRQPGPATWGSLDFVNTTVESRLAYADFDSCGGTTTSDGHNAQVHVNNSIVFIDHCTWASTPVIGYISFNGSSFIVQNCVFPSYPPPNGPESLHGVNGIPAAGYGIFRDNYFGHTWGFNDTIDFTGGNRPSAILQFINNIFDGASDDCLDLDSTDAWIEGNIFMHVHRDPARTDQAIDTGSAISGGVDTVGQNSDWTIINNLFYDVDHVFLNKGNNTTTGNGGGRVAFLNNTVIHVAKEYSGSTAAEIAAFDWSDDNVVLPDASLGSGMYAANNIIYDCAVLNRLYDPAHHTVIMDNNILSVPWSGPGSSNQIVDPRLNLGVLAGTPATNVTVAQLRLAAQLLPGSPALGAGFGGLNLGGLQPHGIAISGEPNGTTTSTSATLTVGPGGTFNWGTTTPQKWGWTAFKWKLDNGAFSAEIPFNNNSPFNTLPAISLSGLSNGPHTVYVVGKNDAPPGYYQDDTFVYPATAGTPARVTASRTWTVNTALSRLIINEVLASNGTTLTNGGTTPDLIEIYNPGASSVDLTGMGLTDNALLPYKFTFPAATTLAPGTFLILFGDTAFAAPGLHTGFSLKQSGDDLSLFDTPATGSNLLDSVNFGLQLTDYSIGRLPDGTWSLCKPTFGSANIPINTGDYRTLKINEWLADAQFAANHDFIELFNPDPAPVALGGLYLSDAAGALDRNPIAPLSFIAGNGFTSFIADGDGGQGADHVNFKLSPDVGIILLSASDLSRIDVMTYGPQLTDVSQGRSPNGSDSLTSFAQPTDGSPNPGQRGGTSSVTNVTRTVLNLLNIPGSSWKWNNDGTDLGTGWQATGYPDATWSNGFGLFGFETTPAEYAPFTFQTFIPAPNSNGNVTVYYRTHFQWNATLTNFSLISTNYVDDGASYYLNGAYLGGVRLAPGANYLALASGQGPEGVPDILTFSTNSLVQGDNVMAVEVHQITCCGGTTSSDDVFGMSLAAIQFTTNIITTTTGSTPVLLNEILADNQTLTNSNGRLSDWIELYNPATNSYDLGDASLSDDPDLPRKFVFPANSIVPSKGYLIIYCDPDLPISPTNTAFGISALGETIFLFDKTTNGAGLVDSISFGLQTPDFAIGRVPAGVGSWVLTVPTRGFGNAAAGLGSISSLRVNEWMANPSSGDDWFEIYNTASAPVALGGLFLTDNLSDRTQSPIRPLSFIGWGGNAFVQFFADGNPQNGANHVSFKLSNSGEAIGIFSPSGTLLNGFSFGSQVKGVSQGRFPDGSSTIVSFPTSASPAESNYLPIPNTIVNEVLSHTDLPFEDAIEVFNPTLTGTNIGGWFLSNNKSDLKKFRIANGTTLAGNGYVVFYESQFGANNPATPFTFNSAHGDEAILSAADAGGNLTGYRSRIKFDAAENGVSFGRYQTSVGFDFTAMSQHTFGVDNPGNVTQFRTGTGVTNAYPKVGPIVINEIMYHPVSGSGANQVEEQSEEFLELRNITGSAVQLFDPSYPTNTWKLDNGVTFQFPGNVTLAANGFILVVGFNPVIDTVALASFRSKYGVGGTVPIFGPWSGHLDNTGDSVELFKPDAVQLAPHPDAGFVPYILVDRVKYNNLAPWNTNANGTGQSLQRLVSSNYGNDPVNWGAGSPSAGRANALGIVDTDGDGMPDAYETANGFNPNDPSDALADADNDGMTNVDEYRAGTDPHNANSNLRITSRIYNGTNFVLQFSGIAGKSYSVLYRADVGAGLWNKVTDIAPPGANGTVTVTNSGIFGISPRFYQVVSPSQ